MGAEMHLRGEGAVLVFVVTLATAVLEWMDGLN
jgi:hypothetical protein